MKLRIRDRQWYRILVVPFFLFIPFSILTAQSVESASTANVEVRFDRSEGTLPIVWDYFGYDEPNYTYAPNGKKLLGELGGLSLLPAYVRMHNLLTSGDGSASLKWGSTNVYTEDASGKPVYNWAILDRIFDTLRDTGNKPLVEIGFMPEALSTHPEPYRHNFPRGSIYTGWAYPPKDYRKWSNLVYEFVRHLRKRYGDNEVKTWLWEVWNEPDIGYWQGTREEYFKLYDYTVEAALRAFPEATIGGPDSTGPGSPKSADFLRAFLNHCASEKNYANGKIGSHLDFISFHPKGSPTWEAGHVRMGISHQLMAIQNGFKIVNSFPEWKDTPIILGESDPEGCAACSAKENPQNLYRNGPLYAAYTVEVLNCILKLVRTEHVHFRGAVTWAFEFEDQPPFAGFRELATDGIDKSVLNAFRMLGWLGNERLHASSSEGLPTESVVSAGVRGTPDINVIAARKQREVEVLLWNYHDDDVPFPAATIHLAITNLPAEVKRGLIEHFRVDSDHSNAFAVWKSIGSPESLSAVQTEQLQSAGQLQTLTSPKWVDIRDRRFESEFILPRQGISLIRLTW